MQLNSYRESVDGGSGADSADGDSMEGQEISSLSSSGSDNSGNIEEQIVFLQEKKKLLIRALNAMKQEEAYDTLNARSYASGSIQAGSFLWQEAKEIVNLLKEQEGIDVEPIQRKVLPSKRKCHDTSPKRKRLRIDLSSVTCISASDFNKHGDTPSPTQPMATVVFKGQWMVKALAHFVPSILHQREPHDDTMGKLEVVDDPNLGLLVMSVPRIPFSLGVSLKTALSFTSLPQLITTPAPPFSIIHANKAFLVFSGLSSREEVICKPVETILRILPEDTENPPSSPSNPASPLKSILSASNKPCKLTVIPITDISDGGSISQLMIKVAPIEGSRNDISQAGAANRSKPLKGRHDDEDLSIFGAVG
eukprot:scaffold5799_cov110-Cylindrotheca_fusiformis.AAC.8